MAALANAAKEICQHSPHLLTRRPCVVVIRLHLGDQPDGGREHGPAVRELRFFFPLGVNSLLTVGEPAGRPSPRWRRAGQAHGLLKPRPTAPGARESVGRQPDTPRAASRWSRAPCSPRATAPLGVARLALHSESPSRSRGVNDHDTGCPVLAMIGRWGGSTRGDGASGSVAGSRDAPHHMRDARVAAPTRRPGQVTPPTRRPQPGHGGRHARRWRA